MGVKVRYQTNKDGSETIWLDCYFRGKRASVWPDLFIQKGTGKRKREEIEQKAAALANARWQEIVDTGKLDGVGSSRLDFIDYFDQVMNARRKNRQWNPMLRWLRVYAIEREQLITFADVADRDWHESFKEFLLDETEIAQTTASNYYKKIICCLEEAVRDRLIEFNPSKGNGIPSVSLPTVYLTPEEICVLANTPEPRRDHIKNAFLFSLYTGLRISDIRSLRWNTISRVHNEQNEAEYQINFWMKKSQRWNYLPISPVALKFIGGKVKKGDDLVFNLYDEKTMNNDLRRWCDAAGIEKFTVDEAGAQESYSMHFHVARHTFACLHILNGTSIYDLKELMCHEHVATTERYARVMDRGKRRAANNMPDYSVCKILTEVA